MAPRSKPLAEEYPVEIVDLRDDFAQSKTLTLMLNEDNRVIRYWVYLKCMKWQIELRCNSFEIFAAYFKSPSTWSAEVEFELRTHITNSVRSDKFVGRFTGANHIHFRPLKLQDHMAREKLKELRVDLVINVIKMQNFGVLHDYFDLMPAAENTLLMVENHLIRVNKQYMAMMSPFFHALFYNEMNADREIFELNDVKFREVLCFIRCVYPHRQPVTKKSIDYLLQLADRYQCQPIVDACEMFMCAHYHEYQTKAEKCFTYVERYKMQRLLRIIVEYISVTQSTSDFRSQSYWRDLSEKTQLAVLEFMAKNQPRRHKDLTRRRGVDRHRANIDPVDDQGPPNNRMLGIADPVRDADPRPPPREAREPRARVMGFGGGVNNWGRGFGYE